VAQSSNRIAILVIEPLKRILMKSAVSNEAAGRLIRVGVVEDNATLRRNLERWLARTPSSRAVVPVSKRRWSGLRTGRRTWC